MDAITGVGCKLFEESSKFFAIANSETNKKMSSKIKFMAKTFNQIINPLIYKIAKIINHVMFNLCCIDIA